MAANDLFTRKLGFDGPAIRDMAIRQSYHDWESSFRSILPQRAARELESDGTTRFSKGNIDYQVDVAGKSTGKVRKGKDLELKQYSVCAGKGSDNKIVYISGQHGYEVISKPLTLFLANELLNPTPLLEEILSKSENGADILLFPIVDPAGIQQWVRSYGDIYTGEKSCSFDRLSWLQDINEWENCELPEVRSAKEKIESFVEGDLTGKPGNRLLFMDLHETVQHIMSYFSTDIHGINPHRKQGLMTLTSLEKDIHKMVLDDVDINTISYLLQVPRSITDNKFKHGKIPFMKTGLMDYQSRLPYPEQVKLPEDGIAVLGPLIVGGNRIISSEWAFRRFKDLYPESLATESFSNFPERRLEDQIIGVEGATLGFLGRFPKIYYWSRTGGDATDWNTMGKGVLALGVPQGFLTTWLQYNIHIKPVVGSSLQMMSILGLPAPFPVEFYFWGPLVYYLATTSGAGLGMIGFPRLGKRLKRYTKTLQTVYPTLRRLVESDLETRFFPEDSKSKIEELMKGLPPLEQKLSKKQAREIGEKLTEIIDGQKKGRIFVDIPGHTIQISKNDVMLSSSESKFYEKDEILYKFPELALRELDRLSLYLKKSN